MADREQDFYIKLRKKIADWLDTREGKASEWTGFLMLAPDLFHLLWKLSSDPEVPPKEKAKLAIAIAYFISPVDLIPEAILGPIGYTDDIALAAYVLNGLINRTDESLVRKHWAGEQDILTVLKRILAAADRMVGSGLFKKLKNRVG